MRRASIFWVIASWLGGALAQRPMRRICESCSQATELTPQQRVWIERQPNGKAYASTQFSEGIGCTYCNMTGYRGHIGIYELLEIDAPLADAIRRGDFVRFSQPAQCQPGYIPLAKRALDYAASGITSVPGVLRVTSGLKEYEQATTLVKDVLTSEQSIERLAT